MEYLLTFLLGFLFSIFVRYGLVMLNRGIFNQGFFGDSSVHWQLVRETKVNPKFKYVKQYLIGTEPTSYPRAFHRYAAFFPLQLVKKFPWLPNLFLFAVFGGFSSMYAYHYFTIVDLPPLIGAFWFCLFFVFCVSNLTFDGPAIAYLKLSERLFARLFVSMYFVALVVGIAYDDMYSIVIAIITGAIGLTAAKFARQSILFVTPVIGVIALSWIPIVVLLFAFVGGLLLFGQQFLNSIKFQIRHLYVYVKKIRLSSVANSVLSNVIDIRGMLNGVYSPKKIILHLINHEPSRSVLRYPELLILGYFLFQLDSDFYPAIISVFAGSVLVYILTSTKYFNFLGESYRYLEYNLTFITPLLLAHLVLSGEMQAGSLVFYFVIVLVLFLSLSFVFRPRGTPGSDKLQEFVDKLKLGATDVVFPVSMRFGADICARSECKSFWWQPGNITDSIFERFVEEYPFLKKDWKPLAKEFSVTHVIVDKSALKQISWSYDFTDLDVIEESEKYIGYAV